MRSPAFGTALRPFKESVDEEIGGARAAAEKVGKKYHLIDEANPTVEVVGGCDR